MVGASRLPTFYELSFAGQLIVWATRKRLHSYASGAGDENTRKAFCVGKLDDLYAALMSIVDVLACAASRGVRLHAVSCPCLGPHEVSILDALAHLQADRSALAYRRIADTFGTVVARLIWPSMSVIASELDQRELRLVPIHAAPLPSPWEEPADATFH
jgi:hypothetical protein